MELLDAIKQISDVEKQIIGEVDFKNTIFSSEMGGGKESAGRSSM
jgi:hypothetical protein